MTTLVWTRTRDDWEADEPLLKARVPRGTGVLHLPCLTLVPLAAAAAPAGPYEHVVLTSANAVAFALRDPLLAPVVRAAKKLRTHGPATARALEAHGLTPSLVPDVRTAAELGTALGGEVPRGARILLAGAKLPAFDLEGNFRARGYDARYVACYDTVPGARQADGGAVPAEMIAELTRTLMGAVCFASPSAVRGFAAVFEPAETRLKAALRAVAIGPTTAGAAARHFAKVTTAASNSVASLVEAGATAL